MKPTPTADEDSHGCTTKSNQHHRRRCSGLSGIVVVAASVLIIHHCMLGSTSESNTVRYDTSRPGGDSFSTETQDGSDGLTAPSNESPLRHLLEGMRERNVVERLHRVPDPDVLGIGGVQPRKLKKSKVEAGPVAAVSAHSSTPNFQVETPKRDVGVIDLGVSSVETGSKAGKKSPTAGIATKDAKDNKGKSGKKASSSNVRIGNAFATSSGGENVPTTVPATQPDSQPTMPPVAPTETQPSSLPVAQPTIAPQGPSVPPEPQDDGLLTTLSDFQVVLPQQPEDDGNAFVAVISPPSTEPNVTDTNTPPSLQPSTIPTQGNDIITSNITATPSHVMAISTPPSSQPSTIPPRGNVTPIPSQKEYDDDDGSFLG